MIAAASSWALGLDCQGSLQRGLACKCHGIPSRAPRCSCRCSVATAAQWLPLLSGYRCSAATADLQRPLICSLLTAARSNPAGLVATVGRCSPTGPSASRCCRRECVPMGSRARRLWASCSGVRWRCERSVSDVDFYPSRAQGALCVSTVLLPPSLLTARAHGPRARRRCGLATYAGSSSADPVPPPRSFCHSRSSVRCV